MAAPEPQSAIRRVLFVLQSTQIGGMETHCVDLAAEYARRAIAVRVILPATPVLDPLAPRFAAAAATVRRLDSDARRGRLRQLAAIPAFVREVRRFRPDVVHLQTGGATGGLGAVALTRLAGARAVVVTEHDVPGERPGFRQRLARKAMDRLLHALIAVSRRNAALRRERLGLPAQRSAAILNGVPIPEVASEARAAARRRVRSAFDIGDDAVVLGSLVRLAPGKGLDDLVRAFAIARLHEDGCRLLIVGDGPLRGDLETLAAELGIGDNVIFAGQQDDPAPYLRAMDVFVLAVPAGSMSIALLEAMAAGLPPVITFCGPEEAVIGGDTGLCAPPSDPEGLGAVLAEIARDADLRARLSRRAAEHARRNYSIARLADDTLAVYAAARLRAPLPVRLDPAAAADPRPGERRP